MSTEGPDAPNKQLSRPKLTIAIPTFNRLEELQQSLSFLVKNSVSRNVEIIVSDNCSTDGTYEYMCSYTRSNPIIKYVRNETNVGPDQNFLNCFDLAQGEYVLLQGDDDMLTNVAIEALFTALEHDPVFVHFDKPGFEVGANNQVELLASGSGFTLYQYRDKNVFLRDIGIQITFMTSLVFRTDFIRSVPNKERFIGTYFIQSHIAICTMAHDGAFIEAVCDYAKTGTNRTVGYDLYHVWGRCYPEVLLVTALKNGFSESAMKRVVHDTLGETVLWFVKRFRGTCENCGEWDEAEIWAYVGQFPDLVPRFWWAVNTPRMVLKVLNVGRDIKSAVRRLISKR